MTFTCSELPASGCMLGATIFFCALSISAESVGATGICALPEKNWPVLQAPSAAMITNEAIKALFDNMLFPEHYFGGHHYDFIWRSVTIAD
jgi:hypothetical protein